MTSEVWFGVLVALVLILVGWAIARIGRRAGFHWGLTLIPILGPFALILGMFAPGLQANPIVPTLVLFGLWVVCILVLALWSWPVLAEKDHDDKAD